MCGVCEYPWENLCTGMGTGSGCTVWEPVPIPAHTGCTVQGPIPVPTHTPTHDPHGLPLPMLLPRWETDVLTPLSAGRTGQILRYSWNVIGSLTDNMIISTSQWRRGLTVWPSICCAGENSRQPKISKSSLKCWCVVHHDLLEILLSRG